VIDYMTRPGGFVDWWGRRHLSSNIIMSDTKEPLSNLYLFLEGKHSTVLVFGFIYNLLDPSPVVTVEQVEKVVKQEWFKNLLAQESAYDAILVMAHMGTDDPLVKVIRDEIREHAGDEIPIQFITGHTHHRRYARVDDLSASFEAGRYLDTVGFVSFPNWGTAEMFGGNATHLFKHDSRTCHTTGRGSQRVHPTHSTIPWFGPKDWLRASRLFRQSKHRGGRLPLALVSGRGGSHTIRGRTIHPPSHSCGPRKLEV
jgi:hypothetical protein